MSQSNCGICQSALIGQIGDLQCSADTVHTFHIDCLLAWSKISNTCPYDRVEFTRIYRRDNATHIVVEHRKPVLDENVMYALDYIDDDREGNGWLATVSCMKCRLATDEHLLLLCDGCDDAYHTRCLDPPLGSVPPENENWFCDICKDIQQMASHSQRRSNERTWTNEDPFTPQFGDFAPPSTRNRIHTVSARLQRAREVPRSYVTNSRGLQSSRRRQMMARLRRDLIKDMLHSLAPIHSSQATHHVSGAYEDTPSQNMKRIVDKYKNLPSRPQSGLARLNNRNSTGRTGRQSRPRVARMSQDDRAEGTQISTMLMDSYQSRKEVKERGTLNDEVAKTASPTRSDQVFWDQFEVARQLLKKDTER